MGIGLVLAIGGAVLSVVLGGIGSTIGVGRAGETGAGVLSEEPEKFGKILLLQALPGTQGVYGFLGAFWIIMKLQLLSGQTPDISAQTGLQIMLAALPVALAGLTSAIFQGRVSSSGMNIVSKQPQHATKGVVLAAMVETYAILGLLATILLIQGIKVG